MSSAEPIESAMKHIALSHTSDDEAVPIAAIERRSSPDRRETWRGGRRDADWTKRPLDAWERAARRNGRRNLWPRWLFAR